MEKESRKQQRNTRRGRDTKKDLRGREKEEEVEMTKGERRRSDDDGEINLDDDEDGDEDDNRLLRPGEKSLWLLLECAAVTPPMWCE